MDTDEEPSGLPLSPKTETGDGRDDFICIVVGLSRSKIIENVVQKNALFEA